jgi:hypothetical protein
MVYWAAVLRLNVAERLLVFTKMFFIARTDAHTKFKLQRYKKKLEYANKQTIIFKIR